MSDATASSLGELINLGQHFAVNPCTWTVIPVAGAGEKIFVLRMETPTGVTGVALVEADFRKMVATCQEALGGITIASLTPGPSSPFGANRAERRRMERER